jgi:hypothetical protein
MSRHLAVPLLVLAGVSFAPRAHLQQSTSKLGPGRKYTTIERVQLDHLGMVHNERLVLARGRKSLPALPGFNDYRAIMHAHAEDATHTGGTRPEMLAAAKKAGIQVILLNDHVRPNRDFIDDSWRGLRDGVLFIPGAEAEGFLVYPERTIKGERFSSRDEYVSLLHRVGGNIFLCHVEERFDWPTDQLDGIEIYNNHTDIKDENQFLFWLGSSLTDPQRLDQLQKALTDFPQEFFGASQDYLQPIIEKWDRDLLSHRVTGVAANDCHHNQGFRVSAAAADAVEIAEVVGGEKPRRVTVAQQPKVAELLKGRSIGDTIARLDIDPYERSMNYVATHILSPQLSEQSIRDALRKSHVYVAHDWLTDASGFKFLARVQGAKRVLGIMGDEITSQRGLVLEIEAPVPGLVKLVHNGKVIREEKGDRFSWSPDAPGVYRVEIWLTVDGETRPWIYSNAIRVRS